MCDDNLLCTTSWAGEEKQPYIQQSQVDKKRYEKESAVYRGAAAMDVDSGSGGNESD
jgi:structure-specific recognition protein 1